jgi:hypothetical protein
LGRLREVALSRQLRTEVRQRFHRAQQTPEIVLSHCQWASSENQSKMRVPWAKNDKIHALLVSLVREGGLLAIGR